MVILTQNYWQKMRLDIAQSYIYCSFCFRCGVCFIYFKYQGQLLITYARGVSCSAIKQPNIRVSRYLRTPWGLPILDKTTEYQSRPLTTPWGSPAHQWIKWILKVSPIIRYARRVSRSSMKQLNIRSPAHYTTPGGILLLNKTTGFASGQIIVLYRIFISQVFFGGGGPLAAGALCTFGTMVNLALIECNIWSSRRGWKLCGARPPPPL